MTDDTKTKAPLTLRRGKLELKKTVETGQVRQSFSHGRSKVVEVERKRKRQFELGADGTVQEVRPAPLNLKLKPTEIVEDEIKQEIHRGLTQDEKAHRLKVLQDARKADKEEETARKIAEEAEQLQNEAEMVEVEEAAGELAEPDAITETAEAKTPLAADSSPALSVKPAAPSVRRDVGDEDDEENRKRKHGKTGHKAPSQKRSEPRRRRGKLTIAAALEADDRAERGRSVAALRRAQEKERRKQGQTKQEMPTDKILREVVLPETITVQELSNRMAEQSSNVIKALLKLGITTTISEVIDADTADLVAQEFGHRIKRVSEADADVGLESNPDDEGDMVQRPPVVTVMGHVDHGKTSLLDALRETDVVSQEAGGITQHIGAYQVRTKNNNKITFIDTPGHEAFTAMRARGARATDVIVLVVAADDGVMPQTIEAIQHAKAAEVPIIVAINKIDRPNGNPTKIKNDLLNHELVMEDLGGEVLSVEVSATKKTNLDKLEEAIMLQAELLDLKANPKRGAEGTIVEAKLEKGTGSVCTVLIQRGTLNVGDVFVAGGEWGRVRALVNDRGKQVKSAMPGTPVEVLGFSDTPSAGDDFIMVVDEARAREVSEFRKRRSRNTEQANLAVSTMEQMFEKIQKGEASELPVVVKADVQGSVEALIGSLEKFGNDEARVRVLHSAVGPINESDVALARASSAVIIGFNVRANAQARELGKRDNVDIRYYSIIYDVSDDMKKLLTGMLAPIIKESFLGYAEIREVFSISKVGKVAGCMVTDGSIKRGCKVRLLRDNTVIHEGDLSQLKRFKDDVKDVREGFECGMALASYQDIKVSDVIECFETEEIAAEL